MTSIDDFELLDSSLPLMVAINGIATLDWRLNAAPTASLESLSQFGAYQGLPPKLELLPDGRLMRLLEALTYTGADGVMWPVPAGIEVDGASIPRPLWSLIGGPFEGPYRDASIVHDHYCVVRTRSWRDTHRMFHDAMRCSQVSATRAKIMYYFVYRFGPRWAGALESVTATERMESLSEHQAAIVAHDAEAIYRHDLDLAEIEALADMRSAQATNSASLELEAPGQHSESDSLARILSIPGGSGTADDVALVASRAALLPLTVLKRFQKDGVRILACRDSVTDFERSLRGVVPRGWESTGKTWNDVPGAYLPAKRRVVVATIATATGGRAIPGKGSGKHGSSDLLIHEALHGFDFTSGHAVLDDPRFRSARTADFNNLDAYERQAGEAGLQETFAESGARFIVEPAKMAASWPALHAYWTGGPGTGQRTGILELAPAKGPIGTIQMLENDVVALDLRAESDDGAIGHAQFTISPGDTSYEALKGRASAIALEATGDPTQPQLFYP